MRAGKTRKVTEMGRLVTRAQLQSAANQIGQHILGGLAKLEDNHDARLARIEKALGLAPIEQDRAVRLVTEDELTEHGLVAQNTAPATMPTNYIGSPKVPA